MSSSSSLIKDQVLVICLHSLILRKLILRTTQMIRTTKIRLGKAITHLINQNKWWRNNKIRIICFLLLQNLNLHKFNIILNSKLSLQTVFLKTFTNNKTQSLTILIQTQVHSKTSTQIKFISFTKGTNNHIKITYSILSNKYRTYPSKNKTIPINK